MMLLYSALNVNLSGSFYSSLARFTASLKTPFITAAIDIPKELFEIVHSFRLHKTET